ncbi:YcaO-like family protein [Sorangium sp. So ce1128]
MAPRPKKEEHHLGNNVPLDDIAVSASPEGLRGCAVGQVIVHAIEDDLALLVTPRRHRYMVPLPAQEVREWLRRCDGRASIEIISEGAPSVVRDLLEKLRLDGCLNPNSGPVDSVWLRGPGPSLDPSRLQLTTVVLVGEGNCANALAAAMAPGNYREVRRVRIEELFALEPEAGVLVVAAFDYPAINELRAIDTHCTRASIPWIPLRYQDGRVFVGPAIVPGYTVDFEDILLRRRAAERDVRAHDVSWAAGQENEPNATFAEWQWIAATIAIRIERWVARAYGSHLLEMESELDHIENVVVTHAILPIPNGTKSVRFAATLDRSRLVDPQTGIINRIREVTGTDGLPTGLKVAVADVSDMRRVLEWPNDRRAFGASWVSLEAASGAAIGEAVERYCGNWLPPDREVITSTYDRLLSKGEHAVDPDTLALYSERQYRTKGFPFTAFRRDSEAGWVRGRSLTHQREIWVPAFLVYVTWHEHMLGSEPRYGYPNLTGIAAGETPEYAILSGLEEVIERDTGMIWWAHARPLPGLPETDVIRRLYADVADRFEARLIPLENEFSIPVLVAAVRDKCTGWLTMGSAARHTPTDAAYKALAEAFSLQQTCRSLDNRQRFADILRSGVQNFGNLKPWREDRRYLDSYRSDFHDVVDLMCQQQLYLDRRAGEHVSSWVWGTPDRAWESVPSLPSRSIESLHARVAAAGYEVISVDVTTRDVAAFGLHVVRTLVPGLVANFPAAFPQWGRARIQNAGIALGWRDRPYDEHELNVFPLAHA